MSCINHQLRGIIALHRKECRADLGTVVLLDKIMHDRGGAFRKNPSTNTAPSTDESAVRAKSGEFIVCAQEWNLHVVEIIELNW